MPVTTEAIPGERFPDNARKGSMGKRSSVKKLMAESAAAVNTALGAQRWDVWKVQEQIGSSCPLTSLLQRQDLSSHPPSRALNSSLRSRQHHSTLARSASTACYETLFQKSKLRTAPCPLVMSLSQSLRREQTAQSSNPQPRTTINLQANMITIPLSYIEEADVFSKH